MKDHTVYVIYRDGKPWKGQDSNKKRRAAYEKLGAAKSAITEEVKSAAGNKAREKGIVYFNPEYQDFVKAAEAIERTRYEIMEYGPKGVLT